MSRAAYAKIAHEAAVNASVLRCTPAHLSTLLEAGPDIPLESALHLAADAPGGPATLGHVRVLVEAGADINSAHRGIPVLLRAVHHRPIRNYLVDVGVDVNARSANGETVFDVAARCRRDGPMLRWIRRLTIRSRGRDWVQMGADPSVLVGADLIREFGPDTIRDAYAAWVARAPSLFPGPKGWVTGDLGLPAPVVDHLSKWLDLKRVS